MLTSHENKVMQEVFCLCKNTGNCLVAEKDLQNLTKYKDVEKILKSLELDGYFELLSSERKGEKMYVLSLKQKGYAYKRISTQEKRAVLLKTLWSVCSGVLAFLVGVILKKLFR